MSHRLSHILAALALLAVVLVGCDVSDDADPTPSPFQSVADIVQDAANFSTLKDALIVTDLLGALDDGQGEFTLFAPNDGAFAALGAATSDGTISILDVLLATEEDGSLTRGDTLSTLLTAHVVPGRFAAADLSDGQRLPTLQGRELVVRIVGGTVYIDGAPVVTTDTPATNGIVHGISKVITSPFDVVDFVSLAPNFTGLVGQLVEAGLVGALQVETNASLTVFAPNDAATGASDAFDEDDLPEDRQTNLLLYHVVAGATEAFDVNGSETLTTLDDDEPLLLAVDEEGIATVNAGVNVVASVTVANGVIHVVDQVLLGSLNVTERAGLTGDLDDLAEALDDAELAAALAGPGPFTVFAPNDDAFGNIDTRDVEQGGFLPKLLRYHVVPGKVTAAQLSDGQMLETLLGDELEVTVNATGVFVDGAAVALADVPVENGVIHVIDAVLLDALTIPERAIATPGLDELVDALTAADLVGALSAAGPFTVFAPDDEAFGAISTNSEPVTDIDTGVLTKILTYHVVPGRFNAADLAMMGGQELETLQGERLTVTVDGPVIRVDGVQVAAADNQTTNGVVHVIGGVLLSHLNVVERVIVTPSLGELEAEVINAGLAEALATSPNITVFAPDNDAFAAARTALGDNFPTGDALADVLSYHVLPAQNGAPVFAGDITDNLMVETLLKGQSLTFSLTDGVVFINPFTDMMGMQQFQARVTTPNVITSNGVVHLVDGVLLPPAE
ncbi:MAG: fasciclin domain-containing protein [Bacteroidota bacterium]